MVLDAVAGRVEIGGGSMPLRNTIFPGGDGAEMGEEGPGHWV